MSTQRKISGTPTRDFKDDGTGEAFTKGVPAKFEPGAHANYSAAGLLEKPAA